MFYPVIKYAAAPIKHATDKLIHSGPFFYGQGMFSASSYASRTRVCKCSMNWLWCCQKPEISKYVYMLIVRKRSISMLKKLYSLTAMGNKFYSTWTCNYSRREAELLLYANNQYIFLLMRIRRVLNRIVCDAEQIFRNLGLMLYMNTVFRKLWNLHLSDCD